jgi:hypothetical protein
MPVFRIFLLFVEIETWAFFNLLQKSGFSIEVASKPQIRFKSKRRTLINTIRCVIPPTRGRKPIRRRLKSYGGTGEKAQSAKELWRMSSKF